MSADTYPLFYKHRKPGMLGNTYICIFDEKASFEICLSPKKISGFQISFYNMGENNTVSLPSEGFVEVTIMDFMPVMNELIGFNFHTLIPLHANIVSIYNKQLEDIKLDEILKTY